MCLNQITSTFPEKLMIDVSAKINNRSVWVTVSEVEPLVTEVKVRVRSSRGASDLVMAAEIDKQIALGLVVTP